MKRSITSSLCALAVISFIIGLATCGDDVTLDPTYVESGDGVDEPTLNLSSGGPSETFHLFWGGALGGMEEQVWDVGPCALYAVLRAMDVQIKRQFQTYPNMSEVHYLGDCGDCGDGACTGMGTYVMYLADRGIVDETNCLSDWEESPDTLCERPYCNGTTQTDVRWKVTEADSFYINQVDIKAKLAIAPIVFGGFNLVHPGGHKYVLMGYTEYSDGSTDYLVNDSWKSGYLNSSCGGAHTVSSTSLLAHMDIYQRSYQITEVTRQDYYSSAWHDTTPPTTGGPDSLTTPEPECGNDIPESGEECDDGNLDNGDGCDSTCHWENTCQYLTCSSGYLRVLRYTQDVVKVCGYPHFACYTGGGGCNTLISQPIGICTWKYNMAEWCSSSTPENGTTVYTNCN